MRAGSYADELIKTAVCACIFIISVCKIKFVQFFYMSVIVVSIEILKNRHISYKKGLDGVENCCISWARNLGHG